MFYHASRIIMIFSINRGIYENNCLFRRLGSISIFERIKFINEHNYLKSLTSLIDINFVKIHN